MGLTNRATGRGALHGEDHNSQRLADCTVALAGNPNVGKSTVFNALTGMHQHTGNWPGKTVTRAQGYFCTKERNYRLVDLPGTYSLVAHSPEEEVAGRFLCFGEADAVVVVCDATCPERNLHLALQILECGRPTVLCFNLMDEAGRKGIRTDLRLLQKRLGIPVVGVVARKKKSLQALKQALDGEISQPSLPRDPILRYPDALESAIQDLSDYLRRRGFCHPALRRICLRLLEGNPNLWEELRELPEASLLRESEFQALLSQVLTRLEEAGMPQSDLSDVIGNAAVHLAEALCREAVTYERSQYDGLDRRMDRVLTGRRTAFPVMLLLLAGTFWLTVFGANYPSQWLANGFALLLEGISSLLIAIGAPDTLRSLLVDGILGVLAWVISVMLPPMAIFFPLFTLLEDAGYLPRVAYNLDRPFHACHACGKQALTMCMGFGCNAAGVVGCRIIDSPRERLLAILTNSLVPCNGRFPALIAILTMFFIGSAGGFTASLLSALLLTVLILFSVCATFGVTWVLSRTLLRGIPSSFALEMPPYRPPQLGKVLVRSVLDRTLFVLGRSAAVAAPAGLILWILANVQWGDAMLLSHVAGFLDPFAALIGMDGMILTAFILGFPANEIVIPIILMGYAGQGALVELGDLSQAGALFAQNGWTPVTALCVLVFFLLHWPCSTTLWTVKKETGSWKWTALAALIPTLCGLLLCFLIRSLATLLQIP